MGGAYMPDYTVPSFPLENPKKPPLQTPSINANPLLYTISTPMTTMPGGLDDEPEPSFRSGRSGSPVKMPPKQALDQYIDLKIAQYNDSSDDDEAL
jgi:hypothetical protein